MPSVVPRAKLSAEESELTVTISAMPPSEITSVDPPKAILQRKLISFHLNRSPRFLWFENRSLMLSFPHHPKVNFNLSIVIASVVSLCWGGVVSTANGQGIQGRKTDGLNIT